MRWLSWILFLPLGVAVIIFSVSNRTVTKVDLWPFGFIVELPVFAIVLASLLLGFVLGGIAAWMSGTKNRRKARAAKHEAASAKRDLAALRLDAQQQSANSVTKRLEQSRTASDSGIGTGSF